MKITIALALATGCFSHLGMTGLAELSYVVAATAAWTFGGRAISTTLADAAVQTSQSPSPAELQGLTQVF